MENEGFLFKKRLPFAEGYYEIYIMAWLTIDVAIQ